jgi:uncharacterized protein YndB with AHSA1/START domain
MDNFVADAIYIDAPPGRVFEAILEPEDILVWMDAESAEVDARPGGAFAARRMDGSSVAGTISALDPGRAIEIGEWSHESGGVRRGSMTLRFLLEPRDDGVWLTVRQDGLDLGPKGWQDFALSTRRELVRSTVALKRHIEGI